jgi:ketosteroid isomerase-like protein
MSRQNVELVLRGYQAFVAGDLLTAGELLDPEIEWHGVGGESSWPADLDGVRQMLNDRSEDDLRIELERCIGKGEEVLVALRASGVQKDETDERPLQTRRYFTVAHYCGIVTVRNGRITRVQDYPHLKAALEALDLDEDH